MAAKYENLSEQFKQNQKGFAFNSSFRVLKLIFARLNRPIKNV